MNNWFENHGHVVGFAFVLAANSVLESAIDTIRYFEKPWKWTAERDRWMAAGMPEDFDFSASEAANG